MATSDYRDSSYGRDGAAAPPPARERGGEYGEDEGDDDRGLGAFLLIHH